MVFYFLNHLFNRNVKRKHGAKEEPLSTRHREGRAEQALVMHTRVRNPAKVYPKTLAQDTAVDSCDGWKTDRSRAPTFHCSLWPLSLANAASSEKGPRAYKPLTSRSTYAGGRASQVARCLHYYQLLSNTNKCPLLPGTAENSRRAIVCPDLQGTPNSS